MIADVALREVREGDLEVFFEHQRDPDAARMAAFPSRERAPFLARWRKILRDPVVVTRTALARGRVAENVVSWPVDGRREVGDWIGRSTGAAAASRARRSPLPPRGPRAPAVRARRQARRRLHPRAGEVGVRGRGDAPDKEILLMKLHPAQPA